MKLLPAVVVVALAFATVAHGAPSSWNPFHALGDIKEFWVNIKCILRVADDVMEESDIPEMWNRFKTQFKGVVEVEWENCLKIDDGVDQEKCKIIVIEHGTRVVTKFLTELVDDHKMDLDWHKLRNDVRGKCFGEPTFLDAEDVDEDDDRNIAALDAEDLFDVFFTMM